MRRSSKQLAVLMSDIQKLARVNLKHYNDRLSGIRNEVNRVQWFNNDDKQRRSNKPFGICSGHLVTLNTNGNIDHFDCQSRLGYHVDARGESLVQYFIKDKTLSNLISAPREYLLFNKRCPDCEESVYIFDGELNDFINGEFFYCGHLDEVSLRSNDRVIEYIFNEYAYFFRIVVFINSQDHVFIKKSGALTDLEVMATKEVQFYEPRIFKDLDKGLINDVDAHPHSQAKLYFCSNEPLCSATKMLCEKYSNFLSIYNHIEHFIQGANLILKGKIRIKEKEKVSWRS